MAGISAGIYFASSKRNPYDWRNKKFSGKRITNIVSSVSLEFQKSWSAFTIFSDKVSNISFCFLKEKAL